jgi:hypothetical protein
MDSRSGFADIQSMFVLLKAWPECPWGLIPPI